MSLPAIILTSDSWNTWFDATNNLISHIANTNSYILIQQTATPNASVGNAAVNGTMSLWTLRTVGNTTGNLVFSVNGTAVLANATLTVAQTASFLQTVSIDGATSILGSLIINSTTTVQNATFSVVNSIATHFSSNSTNANVGTTLYVAKMATLTNSLAVTGNVTMSNATAVMFRLNTAAQLLTVNTNLQVTGNIAFGGSFIANGPLISNALMELGGPIHVNTLFIDEVDLGGDAPIAKLALPIDTQVLRINSITSVIKSLAGLEVQNTVAYRLLTVFNSSTNDLTVLHDSTTATLAVERIICPDGKPFVLTANKGNAPCHRDLSTLLRTKAKRRS